MFVRVLNLKFHFESLQYTIYLVVLRSPAGQSKVDFPTEARMKLNHYTHEFMKQHHDTHVTQTSEGYIISESGFEWSSTIRQT